MAGHTVPIDFRVNSAKISNPVERKTLLQDLLPLIEPFTGPLTETSLCEVPGGSYMALYCSDTMTLSVKLYFNGLVTCTVDYYTDEVNEHKIVNDDGRRLERQIREKFGCTVAKVLPALKRVPPINPYFTSSDDRLLEYDVDKLLFEEKTDFQKVQIYHTKTFGNLLVLDDLQNLAESDVAYTHGLMNKSLENFEEKEILILGGGDGALLWELLKEKPKYVTMIDIDDAVMESCRKHLKSACGTCLDNYNGENYKIIVGDAISYMKEKVKEKKSFDYVFADLTDVPISPSPRGELWDFMRTIMNLGTKLLKPGTGKYMTHATGIQCETALKMFEEQLSNLETGVTFTQTSHYVPSFMEKWCFYQATRQPLPA
nr:spermine synthase-like [Procambarus clarkii]XP_045608967.1 spermine synthase-like [Procambarus clarkii]XP_045608968.1 spermine synthase-like [Procambarus clarkii]XP_045608969.1 spermine synthase-like [Procambarus clarkii]